jgi:type IV secretory pathway VirB2 component (pilin)
MPWESSLAAISASLTGPVALSIGAIGAVAAGVSWALTDHEGALFKWMFRLGLGTAIGAGGLKLSAALYALAHG